MASRTSVARLKVGMITENFGSVPSAAGTMGVTSTGDKRRRLRRVNTDRARAAQISKARVTSRPTGCSMGSTESTAGRIASPSVAAPSPAAANAGMLTKRARAGQDATQRDIASPPSPGRITTRCHVGLRLRRLEPHRDDPALASAIAKELTHAVRTAERLAPQVDPQPGAGSE